MSTLEKIPNKKVREKLAQWYEGVGYKILHIWSRKRPDIEVYLVTVLVPSADELEFIRVWSAVNPGWVEESKVHISIDGRYQLDVSR